MVNGSSGVRLSLSGVPGPERLSVLRDVYGPALNMDFRPLREDLAFDAEVALVSEVTILRTIFSPLAAWRRDLSVEKDDLLVIWARQPAPGRMEQLGREIDGRDGTPVLLTGCDPLSSETHDDFDVLHVRLPRALLAPLILDVDAALLRPISRDLPAFRLLSSYVDIVMASDVQRSAELAHAAATHIADLIALSFGATRDGQAQAAGRGMRAARLAAAKSWVLQRLGEPGLSIAAAAAAQRISPRYVQMLFEDEGTSFSKFLLKERLALAHRLLANPRLAARPISAIAFDAGFGDLSYFNRAFRAAFGETPSDVRHRSSLRTPDTHPR